MTLPAPLKSPRPAPGLRPSRVPTTKSPTHSAQNLGTTSDPQSLPPCLQRWGVSGRAACLHPACTGHCWLVGGTGTGSPMRCAACWDTSQGGWGKIPHWCELRGQGQRAGVRQQEEQSAEISQSSRTTCSLSVHSIPQSCLMAQNGCQGSSLHILIQRERQRPGLALHLSKVFLRGLGTFLLISH